MPLRTSFSSGLTTPPSSELTELFPSGTGVGVDDIPRPDFSLPAVAAAAPALVGAADPLALMAAGVPPPLPCEDERSLDAAGSALFWLFFDLKRKAMVEEGAAYAVEEEEEEGCQVKVLSPFSRSW